MIEILIPAIIMVSLMLGFSVFIFHNITKRINTRVKKYFIDKLQDYNYLIEERKEELEELKKQIEEAGKKVPVAKVDETPENVFSKEIEATLRKMKKFKEEGKELVYPEDIIYDIPNPKYREDAFFKSYKEIKQNFKINVEETIKQFRDKHKNTQQQNNEYKTLTSFKKKFTTNIIYGCLTLKRDEQYELMNQVMTKEEKKIIKFEEKFKEDKDFTILVMLELIDEEIKKTDPNIYVYVETKDADYSYIGENVKTFFYKNMSEGVIINYQGKMYDYSI